uniref:Uncharacterized protein n=1 Tax=Timema monikensis TaxID=170555 RepID=A0A7R9HM24_9NEOP|nr:unnamed protein product [Timema monikensis]
MYGKIFPSTAPKRFTETDLRTRLLSGWVPEDWISSVEFTADTLKLNLIELGRAGSKLIMVAGHVDFMCQEVEAADPVTFTTRDSNLVRATSPTQPLPCLAQISAAAYKSTLMCVEVGDVTGVETDLAELTVVYSAG